MSDIYPVEKFRRVAEYKQTLLLLIIIKLLNLNLKKTKFTGLKSHGKGLWSWKTWEKLWKMGHGSPEILLWKVCGLKQKWKHFSFLQAHTMYSRREICFSTAHLLVLLTHWQQSTFVLFDAKLLYMQILHLEVHSLNTVKPWNVLFYSPGKSLE